MSLKLVFLGPPGAGKGTQADRMAKQFGLLHASTGGVFRAAVAADSELGRAVRASLDAGRLVPDELTSRVVREMVLEKSEGYILDGYPRTLPQADALGQMLGERGEALDGVMHFELDEPEAIRRLTGRLVCERCGANYHRLLMPPRRDALCDRCDGKLVVRSDSSEAVVRKRLDEYRLKSLPLVAYYRERGLLRCVDASEDPESVSRKTRAILSALDSRRA